METIPVQTLITIVVIASVLILALAASIALDRNREAWKEGYRSCLKAHGLPMTERDLQEMRSDPYASMDNAA